MEIIEKVITIIICFIAEEMVVESKNVFTIKNFPLIKAIIETIFTANFD